jgi:hypothetical protein
MRAGRLGALAGDDDELHAVSDATTTSAMNAPIAEKSLVPTRPPRPLSVRDQLLMPRTELD